MEQKLEKVKFGPKTPDLPFLLENFSMFASFLSRLWVDFQKQGENLTKWDLSNAANS